MLAPSRRLVACFAAAGLLSGPGCVTWGPYAIPERIELSAPDKPMQPVRRIVVSDFVSSATSRGTTRSGDFLVFSELLSGWNISAEIAERLRARGIPAEAYASGATVELAPGELLVRGRARGLGEDWGWFPDYAQLGLTFCTLLIYGGLLPYLHPLARGEELDLGVELVDADGRVLSSSRLPLLIYRRNLTYWSVEGNPERQQELFALVPGLVVDALEPQLRAMLAPGAEVAAGTQPEAPSGVATPPALPSWRSNRAILELRSIWSSSELLKLTNNAYAATLAELSEKSTAGPLPTELVAADRTGGKVGPAYRGYYFKILEAGEGGASFRDEQGVLTKGFAALAWPERYDPATGFVWTLLVTQDGSIYARDGGAETASFGEGASSFALGGDGWRKIE
jgi:hypothetical protein